MATYKTMMEQKDNVIQRLQSALREKDSIIADLQSQVLGLVWRGLVWCFVVWRCDFVWCRVVCCGAMVKCCVVRYVD